MISSVGRAMKLGPPPSEGKSMRDLIDKIGQAVVVACVGVALTAFVGSAFGQPSQVQVTAKWQPEPGATRYELWECRGMCATLGAPEKWRTAGTTTCTAPSCALTISTAVAPVGNPIATYLVMAYKADGSQVSKNMVRADISGNPGVFKSSLPSVVLSFP